MDNKPTLTGTQHLLPFGELSPAQFERLCLWLVEHEGYTRAEHLGEAGSEQGRDVMAYRGAELWYFQCKRYQTINAPALVAEVEKYNEHIQAGTIAKPHGIVFVTNAVLSAKARQAVAKFCQLHGHQCEFWARTELDLKVKKHAAIVKEFFNLNLQSQIPNLHSIEIARLPRLLTPDLFGRARELQMLDDAWTNPQTNLISFVAWGGVGKSALVSHWLQALERDNWRGAERVFAWSFYSQGTSDHAATAEYFINAALRWFGGDELADRLQTAGQWEKGERLAQLIRQTRTLLILDGLEPVQHPPMAASQTDVPEGGLKEQTMQALLRELASHQPGLCVVTTRVAIADLTQFEGRSVMRHPLDELSPAAGAELLRRLKVNGTPEELEAAAREYGGHSLALTLLGSYLSDVYAGDVRRRHEIESLEEDRKHGRHARKVLRAYEKWLGEQGQTALLDVLRMLGLFDRPADGKAIEALRAAPAIAGLTDALQALSEREWRQTLAALRELRLLAEASPHYPDTLDAHPLVREHFGDLLQRTHPEAWRAGNVRLYEHLTRTAKEFPDTIEEMMPLYAAVKHGCAAGRYQEMWDEVYFRRIQRGEDFFSTRTLGAFGAELAMLTSFFEERWHQPVIGLRETTKASLLSKIGIRLIALGRPSQAIESLRTALGIRVAGENWKYAAINASSLSEACLVIGRLHDASTYAHKGVELADQSGDVNQQVGRRAVQASVMHQLGNMVEASSIFQEAEEMQKREMPKIPCLYSLMGFMYCDLLLDLGRYQQVQVRADWMLKLATWKNQPRDIGLSHLSLGRAYLLRIQQGGIGDLTQAGDSLNQAFDALQRAGQLDFLPRGLLARAAWARVAGQFDRAIRDLAEASTIAERGEMRLHLADCHLESARLALATGDRDAARKAWETAKAMIEEMGYHRRDGELAEIEQQLKAA